MFGVSFIKHPSHTQHSVCLLQRGGITAGQTISARGRLNLSSTLSKHDGKGSEDGLQLSDLREFRRLSRCSAPRARRVSAEIRSDRKQCHASRTLQTRINWTRPLIHVGSKCVSVRVSKYDVSPVCLREIDILTSID